MTEIFVVADIWPQWNSYHLVYELHLEDAKGIIKAQFALDGTILSQASKPKTQKKK